MKTILYAMLLLLTVPAYAPAVGRWGDDEQSIGLFYTSLSPHGEWIAVEGASYAWRPLGVARDWRPYWNGQWLWSDQGWYWWSPEPWAWATYHYGRWYFDDTYGWVWIPGYEWAPAWVEWRYNDDLIGWAPLGPYAIYSPHIGIRYERYWVTPARWWIFVGCASFTHHELWRHVHPFDQNERYLHRTRAIGSVRYPGGRLVNSGPDRVFIERRTQRPVERAELVPVNSDREQRLIQSDGRERIQVYRPSIRRSTSGDEARPPERVTREGLRLDPRGMDRPAPPEIREPAQRPSQPDVRRMPRTETDRRPEGRPGWNSERSSRRPEIERPRAPEQGGRQATPRGNVREGKREGK